jgi:hypothetical protein
MVLKITGLIIGVLVLFPALAHAQSVSEQLQAQLEATGRGAAVDTTPADPREIAASIVRIFLSLLGTVFFIQMVMSGYWLLTARGEEAKVEKAQATIRRSIIGLAVVLSAYVITQFVTAGLLAGPGAAGGGGTWLQPWIGL